MSRPAVRTREMRVGIDNPIVIQLKTRPRPSEANLLHILGEFPNRYVAVNDLCARLKVSRTSLKIHACRLRKHLTGDWLVQGIGNGYRLIDLRDK
jgi:DNA-binding response OmpR family regulator